jgi:hypothetical protein
MVENITDAVHAPGGLAGRLLLEYTGDRASQCHAAVEHMDMQVTMLYPGIPGEFALDCRLDFLIVFHAAPP